MAQWVLSEAQHRIIASALRQVRLEEAVAAAEMRLRRALSPEQLAGRACARCGSRGGDLRPAAELDGVTLVACVAHDVASEVA